MDGSLWRTSTTRALPVAVTGLSSIIALAAGGNHAMALKSDGTLCAWGANYSGQLGDNTTTFSRTTPVQVSSLGTSVQAIAANRGAGHDDRACESGRHPAEHTHNNERAIVS